MDLEFINGLMEEYTKVIGQKGNSMVKGNTYFQMEIVK